MQTTTNVTASKPAVGGALSRAPYGAALPTNATAALAETFKSLGYISEDGMTNGRPISATDIKAWGGDTVLTSQEGVADTFKTTLIEALSVDVLKAIFGDANVTGELASGIAINVNADEQVAAAWVFDMILKNGVLKRVVIPNGKITAIEDVTYSDSAAVGYGITITAMPDDNGNTHYEYIQNPPGALSANASASVPVEVSIGFSAAEDSPIVDENATAAGDGVGSSEDDAGAGSEVGAKS